MQNVRAFLMTLTVTTLAIASLRAAQPQPNINDLRFTLECRDGTLIKGISYAALMKGKAFQALFSDLGDVIYENTVIPMWGDSAIIRDIADHSEFIAALQQRERLKTRLCQQCAEG